MVEITHILNEQDTCTWASLLGSRPVADITTVLQETYPEIYKGELPFAVPKNWGYEVILKATNERVHKIIYVKAGERLSDQYHVEKEEVSKLLMGEALLHEGDNAYAINIIGLSEAEQKSVYAAHIKKDVKARRITAGDVWHNPTGKIHTIEAVSDILFYEIQTPQLGDVVRLADKYGRTGSKP